MKKNIICIFMILLLTGCNQSNVSKNNIAYHLNIDDTYHEKIVIALSEDAYDIAKKYSFDEGTYTSLEYLLLNTDIHPITTNEDIIYDKRINKGNSKVDVILSHNYPEKDFLNESYIYKCFENYNLVSAEDYFEVSLSGKFYCITEFNQLDINVSSSHDVIESNGNKTSDGYVWSIDKNNFNDTNIYYKISRDYNSMPTTAKQGSFIGRNMVFIIGILIVIGGLFILFKFYQKKKI